MFKSLGLSLEEPVGVDLLNDGELNRRKLDKILLLLDVTFGGEVPAEIELNSI